MSYPTAAAAVFIAVVLHYEAAGQATMHSAAVGSLKLSLWARNGDTHERLTLTEWKSFTRGVGTGN